MREYAELKAELAAVQAREKDLETRLNDLTDFIENASLPLHWVNGSGIIIWANQVELDLLGYAKEEYIGKHVSNFHADAKICEDILRRLIQKETLNNYPSVLVSKNGHHIPVLINSNVRWEGEKFLHTRCFTRNISDLRKLEEEKVNQINELQSINSTLKAENRNLKKELASLKNSGS